MQMHLQDTVGVSESVVVCAQEYALGSGYTSRTETKNGVVVCD